MEVCPCGSGLEYQACCGPYHAGEADAPTAEALMRSRYCAFVCKDMNYLRRTLEESKRPGFDIKEVERWNSGVTWKGLEIVSTNLGGEEDSTGTVQFQASFEQQGQEYDIVEKSRFRKVDGKWYYIEGKANRSPRKTHSPVVRESPKVGRNDPCPCGSGKKFKKCCG